MSNNDKIATDLDTWIQQSQVDADLYWGSSARAQFVQWQKLATWFGVRADVISMHRSKSCKLPVVAFEFANGARVVVRDNFYNIMASVTSPRDVKWLPVKPSEKDISGCYCEGFLDEWVFPSWHSSPSLFTIELQSVGQLVDLIDYVSGVARAA